MEPINDENENDYKVVIVGCGPNGSVMGNLLGLYGIKTLIIESSDHLNTVPRAAHLDDEAIRILQFIGLDKIVLKNSFPLDVQFNRYNSKKTFLNIKNTETEFGHPRSIFWYQPQFEQILADGLKRYQDNVVDVWLGHQVNDYHYEKSSKSNLINVTENANGQSKSIKCKYIIGADGGNSSIRKSMGSKFSGESGAMRWLVVDAILDADHPEMNGSFQFVCDPASPMLTLPIPCGHFRWEFVVANDKTAEQLESVENVSEMVRKAGADPTKMTVVRKAAYTFQNRISDYWYDGNSVFLIGDAAHCLPPFLGMGVSSGMRDSFNLAWKIKLALSSNSTRTLNSNLVLNQRSLFESYMTERRQEVELIGKKSTIVGEMIMSTSLYITIMRDLLIYMLLLFPFVQTIFANKEMKPIVPIDYHGSLVDRQHLVDKQKQLDNVPPTGIKRLDDSGIVRQIILTLMILLHTIKSFFSSSSSSNAHKNKIGFRIPQPNVTSQGATVDLLDNVLGLGFSCIIVNADKDTYDQIDVDSPIWSLLNTTFVNINDDSDEKVMMHHSKQEKVKSFTLSNQDHKKSFHQFICSDNTTTTTTETTVIIVRPDKHVYGIYKGVNDISTITHSLQSTFCINSTNREN
ncbi:FAD-binding monooxygenase [Cavenderia fasciculata]|uniref:FAD-binding monooxygenase n=1 Tax=Cavenderia fasciculata TaxID=261658 RepID=F4PUB0_CACFS|nr:FAD-binding monooxygenase [Cavenderia fasciculata]EGG21825.1 FAD-binding monooxygenase [Cavenderia fasciculata]|eukprot:XP_004359675.1 FAD-binding monooxygenase [Cavenderia fasciculata]